MPTFITSKLVGQSITFGVITSTGYWKYLHNGVYSSVNTNGYIFALVQNANGEFTIKSCDSLGNENGDITELFLTNNQLTSFDGNGLTSLTSLFLDNNQLTSFDGTGLSSLIDLNLFNNQLTSFSGNGLTSLTSLSLASNQLTSFDGIGLSSLDQLFLNNNLLTSIDINTLNSLNTLGIGINPIPALVNDQILNKLAINNNSGGLLLITGTPNLQRTFNSTPDYNYLVNDLLWVVIGSYDILCETTTTTTTFPPRQQPSEPNCAMEMFSCYSILTYKIVDICENEITLDRTTPDYTNFSDPCFARAIVYPPNMTDLYDSVTPLNHYNTDVINFESLCNTDELDVKIWNMNIPWSEDLAGLNDQQFKGFSEFGSINYMGTKEYLGYQSTSGQTDTDSVYYFNSFGDKIVVSPEEQKAIAIIHYTNQTIDFYYGEKFALEPLDPTLPEDTLGQARNFRISIPSLMWHKNPDCCQGQTFWVDPPGFDELDLFQVEYIQSKKNNDMNLPGIRYYHLWDNHPTQSGLPSRVGKVFPDHKIIIIDDEEIIAAMSYKSNRNWTLPAPRTALVTPNTCGPTNQSIDGVLSGTNEYMYVTYRFTNETTFTNSLHCNYYTKIQGPNLTCLDIGSQNVSVRFGGDFNCLNYQEENPTTMVTGYFAEKFEIICQKVTGDGRPDPTEWRIIDYTGSLSSTTINDFITSSGLTGTTFVITKDLYDTAPTYDLSDYLNLTPLGNTDPQLNFGDEYYFYGNVETDIQATIYEMRYKINLGNAEFQTSSNPGWSLGDPSYITEIGLYNSNKELMIISKMQSPIPRQGTQQFLIKYDF